MKKFLSALLLIFICGFCPAAFPQEKMAGKAVKEEIAPVEVAVYHGRIVIRNAPVDSLLEIYSVVGLKVMEIEIKQPDSEYPILIAPGYYIVRIGETVSKIAVR